MVNRWLIETSTNKFICGGGYEPTAGDGQIVVTMPDETMPNPSTERYDSTNATLRRAATASELSADAAAAQSAAIDANTTAAIKASIAYAYSLKLGRSLTTADIPAVQAEIQKAKTYYQFILTNGI